MIGKRIKLKIRNKRMALLVTGYAGFIGSHLTALLDKKNIKWVGYDLVDGNDIRDKCRLDKFFEENQITEVIHLAALAGVRRGEIYPEDYITTNITGTHNLVTLSEKYGVQHFVFYSSSSVYGAQKPPITESFVKKPISLYGTTKLAGERLVEASSIPQTTIVIPFTVYGENGRRDEVVYKWLEQHKNNKPITIFGNGSSMRGYVYVKDLVEATVKIITDNFRRWERESFNLGGSEVIELKQLVKIFKSEIPLLQIEELDMPKVDVFKNYADTSKAQKKLGFEPEAKFEKTVKKIIKQELK